RRRHHVEWLHADDTDERLHGVIGKHASATADAGAGMAGDAMAVLGVGMPCDLVGAYNVDRLTRLRICTGMNWTIRHDDCRLVVLEYRGRRAYRRLVAGNDRDRASKASRAQVLAKCIIGHLAPNKQIALFARAVADAVRNRDRFPRLDEP